MADYSYSGFFPFDLKWFDGGNDDIILPYFGKRSKWQSDISCKRAKCVCHFHLQQWNIILIFTCLTKKIFDRENVISLMNIVYLFQVLSVSYRKCKLNRQMIIQCVPQKRKPINRVNFSENCNDLSEKAYIFTKFSLSSFFWHQLQDV